MEPEQFVDEVRKKVLDENTAIYSDLLEKTDMSKATDDNWKKALQIFQGLDEAERVLFVGFIRQIMTDTLSNLFAILDGAVWLEGQKDDFVLSHATKVLNEGLQDILLMKEEG